MDKLDEKKSIDEFVKKIKDFISCQKYKQVLEYIHDGGNEEILDKSLWDVVPLLVIHLTEDNLSVNKELFDTCVTILNIIAEKYNPAETVLLFLEQVETFDNDVRFQALLKPLATCLIKANLSQVIEWVVSTIKAYIEELPLPENLKSKNEERKSTKEIDPVVKRLIETFNSIQLFLKQLMTNSGIKVSKVENNLLHLCLCLFGAPFSHLPINSGMENYFKLLMDQIHQLNTDPIHFLYIIEDRSNNRLRKIKADKSIENSQSSKAQLLDEITDLAYANFFFTLLTSEAFQDFIPQVYNPHYLMDSIFYLGNHFLKQPQYVLVSKGLCLIDNILQRVETESIQHHVMELEAYTDLFFNLSQVMIYCDQENERKKALGIFQDYIKRFTMRARHLVLLYLFEKTNHSGLLGLITNILKESIIQSLEQIPHCEYFIGNKLKIILKKICRLPHGTTSDLVEISDEVIATLNLIRFLVLRDKTNDTGIWTIVSTIQDEYLKPLKVGVDMARAHWNVKIKDLETQKNKNPQKIDTDINNDITLSVGGENLPPMPIEEKIKFCYQAINALDIIESITVRLNECIEANQIQCIRSVWTSRLLLQSQTNLNEEGTTEETKYEGEEEYEKNIKSKILAASLPFVQELGWSQQTISAGAESIGYPGIVHGMFPNGGAELALHFYSRCNAELNNILKAEALAIQADSTKPKKPPEIHVRDALETRLRMLVPYKSTWPQAIALMALPPNVPAALANLLTLVDDICYYAGDRSVNFNWYTRRVGLAGIYKASELYLLQDNSEDNKYTWEFTERRIEDALQLQRVLNVASELPPPQEAINRAAEAASATFTTARNILGLNWNK